MANIRATFDDNGYRTIDDSDFDSMFLAVYPVAMELVAVTPSVPSLCDHFSLEYERVDSDLIAVYPRSA